MSKSTPISQLPSTNVQDDLMLDDDATVQEVLNQIAQSQEPQQMPMQQVHQVHQAQQQSYIPQMPPQQMYNGTPHVMPQEFLIQPPMQQPNWGQIQQNNNVSKFSLDSDLKTVILVIGIVLIVQIVPLEQFVFKYVAIEHIPYSTIMIKSVIAGAIFVLAKKYIV